MDLNRRSREWAIWTPYPPTSDAQQVSFDLITWEDLTAGDKDQYGRFTPNASGTSHAILLAGDLATGNTAGTVVLAGEEGTEYDAFLRYTKSPEDSIRPAGTVRIFE